MDSHELSEWMAHYTIEPFGEERADLRMGIICSATIAPHIEQGKQAPKPEDFIPDFGADEQAAAPKPRPLSGKVGAHAAKRIFRHG